MEPFGPGGWRATACMAAAFHAWTWRPAASPSGMSLAADGRYLYFTTGGAGNGLPAKSEPFHFVVWEPANGLVWKQQFSTGSKLGPVAAAGGRVLVVVGHTIQVFDPDRMAWEATL